MLAALGTRLGELDGETTRAYVGAIYLLEALNELRMIRKALTTPPK